MKKLFKNIWTSKLAIVIMIIQLIIPIFGGKIFLILVYVYHIYKHIGNDIDKL